MFLHPQVRGRWPLGRIAAVYPGKDGQVRTVDLALPQHSGGREYLRLSDRLLRRDVSSVALLLPAEQEPPSAPAEDEGPLEEEPSQLSSAGRSSASPHPSPAPGEQLTTGATPTAGGGEPVQHQ